MIFHDAIFIEIDLVLRRGGHVNRSNLAAYDWMCQNFEELQSFYNRYGCSLLQHPDGFFFMTLKGGLIRSRLLPKSCVHLGMFLALKARDPEITRSSGWLQLNQLMQDIETAIPKETLHQVYARGRKESIIDERITEEIQRAIRLLASLDFVGIKGHTLRPLEAINRFSELAKYNNEPEEATKIHLSIDRGVTFELAGDGEIYGTENDES